ncbi:TonB-dependent siderophore receptor [Nostoc sp.]|uniref:TonB-dependent siderophore receptor n=1 Tax=Nostoc sp. TaxID=1180 RepID=UPI002FF44CFC
MNYPYLASLEIGVSTSPKSLAKKIALLGGGFAKANILIYVGLRSAPPNLVSATQVPQEKPSAQPKPQEKPSAQSDEPIELVVTGEQDGYRVPNATTATRTDTPILDIPQSIEVVPQQVIKDQQVTRLKEALSNISGVTFNGTTNGRGDTYNLRGFNNAPVLQDGFRIYNTEQPIKEVADLERVEVLKGPASILYGDAQPGGIINLVTKKPLKDPFYEVEQQFGNRNFLRSSVDISGPLNSDGSLLYRLNGLYTQGDSFQNYDNQNQRYLISPTFSWKISDRTDLNVSLRYFDDQSPVAFGLPAQGNRVVDVPRDRIANEPNDSSITKTYLSTGYDLEHRFSENWKLHSAFHYLNYDSNTGVVVAPFALR